MPENADLATGPEVDDQPFPEDGLRAARPGKLKLLAFAVLVVLAECVVAYLYIPTGPGPAAAAAVAMAESPPGQTSFESAGPPQEDREDLVEVDLGEFAVTSFQPLSGTTIRIDFHLFATVAADDNEDFNAAMQESRHRIRDQVIVILRSSDLEDLTDAGLGLIKRKILEKTNRTLGRPFLKTTIFSDFSFIEQ